MAKPKSPILSLGASGTIGDALTYQKHNQGTIVREKPIPAYRYTLPQAYQRWLYQDYAYLWTQQSEATKRQYAATGSRFHLTGFQYWMKYQLANLPDIAAWWKLDDNLGATTIDSSRNNNIGTVFGASPAIGIIDKCLSFDGINDYIRVPHSPSLAISGDQITLEVWMKCLGDTGWYQSIGNKISGYQFPRIQPAYNQYIFYLFIAGGWKGVAAVSTPPDFDNQWLHAVGVYDGSKMYLYFQGDLDNSTLQTGDLGVGTDDFYFGAYGPATQPWNGLIDNVIIYNRALDATEIKRHSARRYPP